MLVEGDLLQRAQKVEHDTIAVPIPENKLAYLFINAYKSVRVYVMTRAFCLRALLSFWQKGCLTWQRCAAVLKSQKNIFGALKASSLAIELKKQDLAQLVLLN